MDLKSKKLKPSDKKILKGIMHLADIGLEPTAVGISSYLSGDMQVENEFLKDDAGFGCLSCTSKKIKNKINIMIRYGYIKLNYDESLDEVFLSVSDKGATEAEGVVLKKNERTKEIHFRKINK